MKALRPMFLLSLLLPLAAVAADADFTLSIRDHRFQPAELTVPAGQKIKLRVENQDATPEEFESKPLDREKVVSGKGSIVIHIGPLAPGRYPFSGEYHKATAQGVIVAK